MKRYPFLAMLLHWLSAAAILWALCSGFALASGILPPIWAKAIPPLNIALTTLLLPFWLLRLFYRLTFRMPPPADMAPRDWAMAKRGHLALYALGSLSLLSGILMMERPMSVFGWFTLAAPLPPGLLTSGFALAHFVSNVLLALAVAAHISAVAVHHSRGLPILRRMSSGRSER
ncbi:cytochrome b/b6 domain-containing protein [Chromobacterium violaceum]|uniref:Cytochrome B n=1 Tax=Chromobacterium violaceum TaxID=536 RepID=A0A202BAN7_CHRVL|nr:cytochrome b/b6 domain-containing protein [Chromobacterium violaceum]OVE48410.1 cytochrome B [Chromobacterium violaceum]